MARKIYYYELPIFVSLIDYIQASSAGGEAPCIPAIAAA